MAALLAGERDPKVLAQLSRARMRAKITLLEEAFVGHFTDYHAFLLATMLAQLSRQRRMRAVRGLSSELMIVP